MAQCVECARASIDSTDNTEAEITGMDDMKVTQCGSHSWCLEGTQGALLFCETRGHCRSTFVKACILSMRTTLIMLTRDGTFKHALAAAGCYVGVPLCC